MTLAMQKAYRNDRLPASNNRLVASMQAFVAVYANRSQQCALNYALFINCVADVANRHCCTSKLQEFAHKQADGAVGRC